MRAESATQAGSVLVTGGAGLIGQHAVQSLVDRGWNVSVTGRGGRPAQLDDRVQYQTCNLTDPSAHRALFAGGAPDVLLHLAWFTEHGRFWSAPENLEWVAASLQLVRGFAEAGGKRVVAAGTCVEYAAPDSGPCVAGETPLQPFHLYAVSKDAFRRMAEAYCRDRGISCAWGRVFLVTGASEAPGRLVPSIARSILAGNAARCSSGTQVRDVMDVRDCGAGFAMLAASDYTGAMNICSGVPVKLADVAMRVGTLMGRPDLVQIGALPDRAGEAPNLWGEASPLADVGFQPRYTLDQALASAIASWQASSLERTVHTYHTPGGDI